MITEVLREGDITLVELDAVVVGNGSGSVIGMRIAASVAQGLAFGAGVPVVPVSSMLVVAAEVMANDNADHVVVCQDAYLNEVYLGRYARGALGLRVACGAERLYDQTPIIELRADPGRFTAAGFGWLHHPALL